MIRVEFTKSGELLTSFSVSGHAGYDDYGHDIVCAPVTSAVQLTANGITEVLKLPAKVDVEENLIRASTSWRWGRIRPPFWLKTNASALRSTASGCFCTKGRMRCWPNSNATISARARAAWRFEPPPYTKQKKAPGARPFFEGGHPAFSVFRRWNRRGASRYHIARCTGRRTF